MWKHARTHIRRMYVIGGLRNSECSVLRIEASQFLPFGNWSVAVREPSIRGKQEAILALDSNS